MKNKFTWKEKVFFSPWAILTVAFIGIGLMNVVAFADHDIENYQKQKANIDMANDGIVGYTHDGFPVYQSEIDEAEAEAKADLIGQAIGLRQLNIQIKGTKKVNIEVLNSNTVELLIDDKVYSMILDCKLNEIDNIQFFTWPIDGSGLEGDSKLDVGDFGIARRDPFKYFDNPKLRESLTKEYVEEKLDGWDIDERVCVINAIQLTETIKVPEVSSEAVRG